MYPVTHFQCEQGLDAVCSLARDNVEDGIGFAGALDAVVDDTTPFFGAISRGDSGAGSLGVYDVRWAGVSEEVEGRRKNEESLGAGAGKGGAFVESHSMPVQEGRGPRVKAAVIHRYWAIDEKAVACVARSSSAGMRDVTSLFVGKTEEVRNNHCTSRWTRITSLQVVCK